MSAYLARRGFHALIVLAVMSFLIYTLMGLMPGDPIDIMLSSEPDMTTEDAARLRALYGLDQPLVARYLNWLSALLSGDPGYSRLHGQPVFDVIGPAVLNTAKLIGAAFVLAAAIGVGLGLVAGAMPRSLRDYAINIIAFAGISVPPFWVALLLILVFAVALGWLPAGGMNLDGTLGGELRHLALPVLALTVASVGGYTRYTRAAVIEAMRQDYIRTARAKGLNGFQVVVGHAMRNAMIPVVTLMALDVGTLFSGALITETVFAYPGMGKLIFDAIMGNDFNLALVALLLATFMTLAGNLLGDLGYVALDPRVRLDEGTGR
ncbi:MAG: ABC transporter permease [Rhodospirillales bacterium]